jgi:hypothetical protein
MPECGSSAARPTCEKKPVCAEPTLACAAPVWSPEYRAWTKQENAAEGLERYERIAADAVFTSYATDVAPLFSGPKGRGATVIYLLSNVRGESGLRKDIEEARGWASKGDHGASFCLGQINIGVTKTSEGWTGEQLAASHDRCFRASLRIARGSFHDCRKMPRGVWLSAYIAGHCQTLGDAALYSTKRMRAAENYIKANPVPALDADVQADLAAEVAEPDEVEHPLPEDVAEVSQNP